MIECYRITKATTIKDAFSGEGSRLYGGRWNSKGVPLAYTAATRSLAILEVLVHMRNTIQTKAPVQRYLFYPVQFDEGLLEDLSASVLPADWMAEPPRDSTKTIGDAWASGGKSPVLSVPSAIVPEERNYLLNPNHAIFSRIQFGQPVPCQFDPRLL